MTEVARSPWYIANASGEREGPFSTDDLVSMRLSRSIEDTTPCWWQGMGEWTPLGQIPTLMTLIDSRKMLARRRVRTIVAVVAVAVVAVGGGVFAVSRMRTPGSAARDEPAGSGSSAEAQASAPLPPELKPLQRFIGSWEQQVVLNPAEWNLERRNIIATTEYTWILDGRVLQNQSVSEPDGTKGMVLTTYDTDGKEYRQWYFDSNGALPADGDRGQWNEAAKTFMWKGTDRWGNAGTHVYRFIDHDHFEWRLVVKDYSGKVMSDMEGKAKRQ